MFEKLINWYRGRSRPKGATHYLTFDGESNAYYRRKEYSHWCEFFNDATQTWTTSQVYSNDHMKRMHKIK